MCKLKDTQQRDGHIFLWQWLDDVLTGAYWMTSSSSKRTKGRFSTFILSERESAMEMFLQLYMIILMTLMCLLLSSPVSSDSPCFHPLLSPLYVLYLPSSLLLLCFTLSGEKRYLTLLFRVKLSFPEIIFHSTLV